MHFNQIVQLLLLFVTAALAELIPFGPIVSFLLFHSNALFES